MVGVSTTLRALELAQGADALVHDAQLMAHELASSAFLGHAAADYAVELGGHAGTHARHLVPPSA